MKPREFSKWSTRRPGVAMMTWGFLASPIAWVIMSIPPTTTAAKPHHSLLLDSFAA